MQSENSRSIFNLPVPEINVGAKANLTLFLPDVDYVFDNNDIYSKSKNNAFAGKKLKGQSLAIINGNKVFLK